MGPCGIYRSAEGTLLLMVNTKTGSSVGRRAQLMLGESKAGQCSCRGP